MFDPKRKAKRIMRGSPSGSWLKIDSEGSLESCETADLGASGTKTEPNNVRYLVFAKALYTYRARLKTIWWLIQFSTVQ